jgi:aspartate kinase
VALIVQKYGGTSVANVERIRLVAQRVIDTAAAGNQVAVVVSAMAGETDALVALAKEAGGDDPDPREYDALVSTGEQKTIALLAMVIRRMGRGARSFTGAQMGMRTDASFTRARIRSIDRERILDTLAGGNVAVIAGFQGIDDEGNITTLGRGGSDTSAVAVAAALEADVCEIYTDVNGVYTTDPNMVPAARKLDRISFEEMLEMASLGAKVLQIRSVKLAQQYGVPLHVRSTFETSEGTWVTREEDVMERLVVSGVTYARNEAKIRVRGVKDQPGVSARLFTPISDAGIVVDVIVQNVSQDGSTDITFTVPRGDAKRALELSQRIGGEIGAQGVEADDRIAKVSIVGLGMKDHAGVASKMFRTLADEGINIQMISTSEIKVSVVIDEKYTELAVRALHAAFVEDGASEPKAES